MLFAVMPVIVLSLVVGQASFAQTSPIDRGSKLLDGGFSFTKTDGDLFWDETVITLDPYIGFFVSPGVVVGGRLVLERYSISGDAMTTMGLGPELRYYFHGDLSSSQIKSQAYPYVKGGFIYSKTKEEDEFNDFDRSRFTLNLGGGIAYMLSSAVAVNFEANFDRDNLKADDRDRWVTGSKINFAIGFSFFLY